MGADFGQVFVPCEVYSVNEETGKHWRWRARIRKEIRGDAKTAGLAALEAGTVSTCGDTLVQIIVEPSEFRPRGRITDAGNCVTSAKCAIDGLRDAGIIVDDNPRYVRAVTFLSGKRVGSTKYQGLKIMFREW